MPYKTWLMYSIWIEVFGTDRATGQSGEDILEMFNKVCGDEMESDDGDDEDECFAGDFDSGLQQPNPDTYNQSQGDMDADSEAPPPAVEKAIPDKGRAQKKVASTTTSGNDMMVSMMERFVILSDQRLGSLCNVLGYEANLGKDRQEIFTLLDFMTDLNMDQKIDVSKILAKNPRYLDMFLGFPAEARAGYVYRLLRGDE